MIYLYNNNNNENTNYPYIWDKVKATFRGKFNSFK